MNSFNRKIAEKFGPQRAKPKKFGCLGNFLHGALRPCIFIARHPANCLSLRQRRNATNSPHEEEARSDRTRRVSAYIRLTPASEARISPASCHPEHSEGSKTLLSQRYFADAQYGISALQTLKITASGTIEKTQEELYH